MDDIVGPELVILIIVLIVVLVWRGPSTLPRLGEALGKAVKSVRDNMPAAPRDESDDEASDDSTASDGSPDASSRG